MAIKQFNDVNGRERATQFFFSLQSLLKKKIYIYQHIIHYVGVKF